MSRNSDADTGSLELLLDTICNTFGGVIFIAILVVVLLQMTGKATPTVPTEQSRKKLEKSERDLVAAQAELEALEKAAEQFKRLYGDVDPNLVRQHVAVQEELKKKLNHRTSLVDAMAKQQVEINNAEVEAKAADDAMKSLQSQMAVVMAEISKEAAENSKTAKLPRVRQSAKREMAMLLRDGKLHLYHVRRPDGTYGTSADECDEQNGGTLVSPRPGTGLQIDTSKKPDIERRLAQFDVNQHYLAVCVWPESFDQFAVLRDVFVKNNFEYRLILLPADQAGVHSSPGSGSRNVQ